MSLNSRLKTLTVACLTMLPLVGAVAQETDDDAVTLSGSATVTGDFYDMSRSGNVPVTATRPPSLVRFIIAPTVTLGGKVSLPFSFMFSSTETSTITPPIKDPTLAQFLQNQANSFSISPKIDWAEFHLGSHSPTFSELSVGNVQVFGVGTDLRPGKLHFAASAGSTQRAVEVDTAAHVSGAFARYLYAATLGYAIGDGEINLNVVRARDDPASIHVVRERLITTPDSADPTFLDTTFTHHPLMPSPKEGMVATLSTRIPISDATTISAEVGGGMFTNDMAATPLGENTASLNTFVLQRTSSRADVAGKLTVGVANESWGVTFSGIYVGPGYTTLGYPYMANDRLEFTATPRFRLFDSVLNITATIGHRTNNLTKSLGATATQLLASTNIDAHLSSSFDVSVAYMNFGLSTDVDNDTFRVRSISQSFTLAPTLTLQGDDATHIIGLTLALDDYDDLNPITGAASANNTRVVMGMYNATLTSIPLTGTVNASYLTNNLPTTTLAVTSVGLSLGYSLFDGNLTPGLAATFTSTRPDDLTPDNLLGLRLSLGWRITSKLTLMLAASSNAYDYGSSRANSSFTERLLRTSLSWRY